MIKTYFIISFFLLVFSNVFSQNFTTHPIDDDFGFARGMRIVNLDNDDNLDIVSLRIGDFVEISCWFGDGNGNFGTKVIIHQSLDEPIANLADDLNVLDINNDGFLDVVASTQIRSDIGVPGSRNHTLAWWPNNQDGTFGDAVIIEEGVGRLSNNVLIFDVDNNNFDDIVIGDAPASSEPNSISFWANDGIGGIATRQIIKEASTFGIHNAFINDDNFQDIVYSSGVVQLINNGDGTFGDPITIEDLNGQLFLTSGDVNGDSHTDLLVSGISYESSLVWYEGDGNGNFQPKKEILFNKGEKITPAEPFLADLDNDGDQDVVFTTFTPYQLLWWANDGDGNFGEPILVDDAFNIGYSVKVADLNENGNLDIIVANASGIYWFENNDVDNDGVLNDADNCSNTPNGAPVDADGCEIFTLPVNNFAILVASESCRSSDNGSISVTAQQALNYTATLSGNGVNDAEIFNETTTFVDLSAGEYNLCITIEAQTGYEQCFNLTITEPEDLGVSSKINTSFNKLSLTMTGGEKYTVTLNNRTFETTESELELDLTEETNQLSVKTDKECQGSYEETIMLMIEALIYPNPIQNNQLFINLGQHHESLVNIELYSLAGKHISSVAYSVEYNSVQMDMSTLAKGMYILKIHTPQKTLHYKIIK
ncbi:MAG: hypothetical protein COA50_06820 [Flavobacteriaceae bacterium]|nr:MAG: hypothetical protein COA50_06820 [Flavobacteriaceae bacterium]